MKFTLSLYIPANDRKPTERKVLLQRYNGKKLARVGLEPSTS
jgi:hypothetical protein